jgi:hypothetical protein
MLCEEAAMCAAIGLLHAKTLTVPAAFDGSSRMCCCTATLMYRHNYSAGRVTSTMDVGIDDQLAHFGTRDGHSHCEHS